MNRQHKVLVKVVKPPLDESPKWVREAWVGMQLPAHARRSDGGWRNRVHSRQAPVFEVRTADAVEAFRQEGRHAAAQWWAGHALLRRGGPKTLVFADGECRVVRVSESEPVATEDPARAAGRDSVAF